MRPKLMTALSPLFFAVLLTTAAGCASQNSPNPPPELKVEKLLPPNPFLQCMNAPEPPKGAYYTQRNVADYVTRLAVAGNDCRLKLEAISRWTRH